MKKELMIATVSAMLMTSMQVQGSRVAGGDKPKDWPANAARHVLKVERKAADDTGKKMIAVAEAAKPGTGVWWMTKEGSEVMLSNLKMPYALTLEALDYYTAKIKAYQKQAWPNRYSEPQSSLSYNATCDHQDKFTLDGREYKDVYVVKMEMKFEIRYTEETVGGLSVEKMRTVVLDSKGSVQAVSGDKNEDYAMWME